MLEFLKKDTEENPKTEGANTDNKDSATDLENLLQRRNERIGKDTGKTRGRPKAKSVSDQLQESLYSAKTWSEIGALPFDVRRFMTGSEIFILSEEQRLAIGGPLAVIMQDLISIDPKYAAVAVLCINLGKVWVEKEIEYALSKKREKTNDTKAKS